MKLCCSSRPNPF